MKYREAFLSDATRWLLA